MLVLKLLETVLAHDGDVVALVYIRAERGYAKADTESMKKRGNTQKRVHNALEYFLWDSFKKSNSFYMLVIKKVIEYIGARA